MCSRLRDCVWLWLCVLPPAPRQVSPPPLQSRCAGLSRGNFRVGGGFVCTGRCLGGGDGREGYFSPLFLFIGSLTTARTAAAPPLSCLPRLPPLSPSAARRNSMPIRFGARRQPDQRPGRGAGGSGVGGRLCSPRSRHPPWVPPQRPGSDGGGPAQPGGGVRKPRRVTRWWVAGPEPPGLVEGHPGRPVGCRLRVPPWRAWPLGGALEEFGNN